MKTRIIILSALLALGSAPVWAQTNNISSVGITTGVVTVTARIGPNSQPVGPPNNSALLVGNNLAGLAYAAGNIPGAADTSISFFTLTAAALPGGAGNPLDAFMSYGTLIGPPAAVLNYPDVAPLLTANSYLGLTFAATNLYPGGPAPLTANGFYTIHRNLTNGTDYLAGIVPATGGGSAVLNIKPMAWTGGVAATGASVVAGTNNFFALTFALPTPTGPYFANLFYYLRTDASSHTQFGYVIPALTSGFSDTLDLNTATGGFGATGYASLAFSATSFGGYAVNQFYYLRLDTATGNTILGRLDTNPAARTLSDIANLGGVYTGLTFAAEATGTGAGWGSNQLYATGTRALTAQSVSFAAIADRTFLGDVPFVVTPSASSGLDLVVTVVSGPATVVTTGPALSRVHTVTTTGPGVVKLRATQSGPGFITNWLDQSFNVLGLPSINSAATTSATAGTPFTFNVTATGNPILSYAATGLPANGLTFNTTSGVISGTPLAAGTINVTGITATNATGVSAPGTTLTITVAAAGVAPVVNSALAASGTVGTAFNYTITGTNSPTSFSASPLPAGVTLSGATLSGTPTTAGVTSVILTATNVTGTSPGVTLTITIAAAVVVPPPPPPVPPAILAVLPLLPSPVTNWSVYQPAQIKAEPVPGVNATFNMTYRQEGAYNVGVGRSVIPGESLVTVANGNRIDLIVTLMDNGLKEYDVRIRGDVVTTILKTAIGLCATEEQVLASLPGNSPTTVAGTIVSVLFFYDESTAAAADQLTIEAYGIAVIENGNLVLQNSNVTNLRWRYTGAVKVAGYTSNGNTLTDLTAMGNASSVLGAFVLQKSNELVADQALFLFNAFQANGASGRAERPGHNSTVYWQAPWYVYIHQLGHNFGCHHDRAFDSIADGNGQFSYGFAWTKPLNVTNLAGATTTIQVGYGTIMTYWGLNFIQPYFSAASVSITYAGNRGTNQEFIETRAIGVAVDQPKAADDARTMREAALPMAGYRVVAGNPTTPAPVVTPVVTPPAASSGGGGGGAPSLWFFVALSGLAAFRRKFMRK